MTMTRIQKVVIALIGATTVAGCNSERTKELEHQKIMLESQIINNGEKIEELEQQAEDLESQIEETRSKLSDAESEVNTSKLPSTISQAPLVNLNTRIVKQSYQECNQRSAISKAP